MQRSCNILTTNGFYQPPERVSRPSRGSKGRVSKEVFPLDRIASVRQEGGVARRLIVVELMEEQDNSTLPLSDEQAAEVRRRLVEQNPKTVTLAEFNERLRRRHGV